jgi:hypothetical protein
LLVHFEKTDVTCFVLTIYIVLVGIILNKNPLA